MQPLPEEQQQTFTSEISPEKLNYLCAFLAHSSLSLSHSLLVALSGQCLININRMVAGPRVPNPLVPFVLMSRYSCHYYKEVCNSFLHFPSCNLCHFCFGALPSDPNTCCACLPPPPTLSVQSISLFRYDNLWPNGGGGRGRRRKRQRETSTQSGTQRSEQSSTLSMQLLLSLSLLKI